MDYYIKQECRLCESKELKTILALQDSPLCDAYLKVKKEQKFYPLQLNQCVDCGFVQINCVVDPEIIYRDYIYVTTSSSGLINHFENYTNDVFAHLKPVSQSLVVDIGSNDGTLLSFFQQKDCRTLGIEPSINVAQVAMDQGINVITEFFDKALAENISNTYQKADAILSANVMCHIPYMHSIFDGVKVLLKSDGVFIFEDPYLGEVIEKTSFDQIYDEHVFLFSALSVSYLANMHDLELVNVKPQITHGGSMRYTIAHKGTKIVSQNVFNLIEKEKKLGLDKKHSYLGFTDSINQIKDNLIDLLTKLNNEGKKVVAYGATSKSTTVTNYFGITPNLVECIYDTTPIKQNKFSPGVHIPVLPYSQFRESNPDYVLLFAWNHSTEIMKKEKDYMNDNRHWITYIPNVKVI